MRIKPWIWDLVFKKNIQEHCVFWSPCVKQNLERSRKTLQRSSLSPARPINKISPYSSALSAAPQNTVPSTAYPLLLQDVKKDITDKKDISKQNLFGPPWCFWSCGEIMKWNHSLDSTKNKGALLYIPGGESQRASHRATTPAMGTKWPVNGRPCVVSKTQLVLSTRRSSLNYAVKPATRTRKLRSVTATYTLSLHCALNTPFSLPQQDDGGSEWLTPV